MGGKIEYCYRRFVIALICLLSSGMIYAQCNDITCPANVTINCEDDATVSTIDVTLYDEDFSGQDGDGVTGDCDSSNGGISSPTDCSNWSVPSGNPWTLTGSSFDLENGDDYVEVVSGALEARDIEGEICFETIPIDISTMTSVDFSLVLSESGNLEVADYVNVSYSLNGGATFTDVSGFPLTNDFTNPINVSESGFTGSSLILRVCFKNGSGNGNNNSERYFLDDVLVTGATISAATGVATSTGNCGPFTITPNDVTAAGSCANESVITRTWTATDASGNSETCDQIITVVDITPPTLTCPADVTTGLDCASGLPTAEATLSGTDNCGATSFTVTNVVDEALPTTFCAGDDLTITRTYMAEDACGNEATCVQSFTFSPDTTPPTLTCPADVTTGLDSSTTALPTAATTIGGTDNCGATSFTVTNVVDEPLPTSFCATDDLTITRTYTAEDACGNSSTCIQSFTFSADSTPPIITCPANVTINCEDDATVSTIDVTLYDEDFSGQDGDGVTGDCDSSNGGISSPTDCSNWSVPSGNPWTLTGSSFDLENGDDYVEVVSGALEARDIEGEICFETIPIDISTMTSVDFSLVLSESGNLGSADYINVSYSINGGATFSDVSGFPLTNDFTNPINVSESGFTGSSLILRVCFKTSGGNGKRYFLDDVLVTGATISAATGVATSTGNCGPFTITPNDVTAAGSCANESVITRTWTATDASGNSETCDQIITVVDITPPTLTCPADVTTGLDCASGLPTAEATLSGTDNCGATSFTVTNVVDEALPTTFCAGDDLTITRTYTAEDDCGNAATCVQSFTYSPDTTIPTLTCPADVTTGLDCTTTSLPTAETSLAGTDNCVATSFTVTDVVDEALPTTFCAGDDLTITRTYTAEDACGNESTCIQSFTFSPDTTIPTLTCPADVTTGLDCTTTSLPTAETTLAGVNSNCGATSFTVTNVVDEAIPTTFCAGDDLTITRTYTAEDACGNSSTCVQSFTFSADTTPPNLTCPADVTTGLDCTTTSLPTAETSLAGTDNCGATSFIVTNVLDEAIPTSFCATDDLTVTRTYTAADACGNAATCIQSFTFSADTTPPTLTCPSDVSTGLDCTTTSLPTAETTLAGTDNCGATSFTVTNVLDEAIPTSFCATDDLTVTRTYTAADACGNAATCIQSFTFSADTTPPTITCPPDQNLVWVFGFDATDPNNTGGFATGNDNCISSPVINRVDNVILGECSTDFTIERTWTATDKCNFSTSCVQTIVVQGQCCAADAGDISLPTVTNGETIIGTSVVTICLGDDLGAFSQDYTTEAEEVDPDATAIPGMETYQDIWILAEDDANGSIITFNTTGDFDLSVLTVGTYDVYVLNYYANNTPTNAIAYIATKANIAEIVNDDDDSSSSVTLTSGALTALGTGPHCLDITDVDTAGDAANNNGNKVQIHIREIIIGLSNPTNLCVNSGPLNITNILDVSIEEITASGTTNYTEANEPTNWTYTWSIVNGPGALGGTNADGDLDNDTYDPLGATDSNNTVVLQLSVEDQTTNTSCIQTEELELMIRVVNCSDGFPFNGN